VAAKPESALAARLRDNLIGCCITRLESRIGLGIPDCLIAFRKPPKIVMVELKVVKTGRQVRLSPHQISFHARHSDYGVPTFVLVEWQARLELRLYHNKQVIDLAEQGWAAVPCWQGPSRDVPWHLLRVALVA